MSFTGSETDVINVATVRMMKRLDYYPEIKPRRLIRNRNYKALDETDHIEVLQLSN